jgi:hypothetical protein
VDRLSRRWAALSTICSSVAREHATVDGGLDESLTPPGSRSPVACVLFGYDDAEPGDEIVDVVIDGTSGGRPTLPGQLDCDSTRCRKFP